VDLKTRREAEGKRISTRGPIHVAKANGGAWPDVSRSFVEAQGPELSRLDVYAHLRTRQRNRFLRVLLSGCAEADPLSGL